MFSILKPRGGIYFPEPQPREGVLSLDEREEISRGIAAGDSVRRIASKLGRAASTVSREINKNKKVKGYRAVDAHDRALRRARRPQRLKLQKNPVVRNYVAARLKQDWSPEQIAGRLLLDYPDSPRMHISHEAIYRAIYLNSGHNALPHNIHHHLRRHRPLRHSRYYTTRGQWRSQIKNARPISDRPGAADQRAEPGHFEGDLLIGSKSSQIATLVNRCTRETHIVQLADRSAQSVKTQLSRYLTQRPWLRMRTLTWDRGMELAEHQATSGATGVEIFFADPRSPWQRGTNENTNGLLRQYLPKKTSLATYDQTELDDIPHRLNTRPRKTLGYRTPLEATRQGVALTN